MNRILGILFILLGLSLASIASAVATVDLRLFPFSQQSYNILDPWDFHLADAENSTPISIVQVIPREHGFGSLRHGTFYLKIVLPESASRFALFFPELRSASRVTIDGKVVSERGRVGRTDEEEEPAMHPFIHRLEGEAREVNIKVEMSGYSNYQFLSSSTPISIGYQTSVFEKQQAAKIRDAFAVGAIFIMAFYHFALFALRRERIDPLLFGMFCVCIGMRTIVRSDGLLLYHLFEQPNFYWQYRFEYWGINLSTATCMYFMYVLFHKTIPKIFNIITVCTSLMYAVLVGVLPLPYHGVLLIPFEILILVSAVYLVKCIWKAKPEQRDGSLLMATGFGLFMLTTLNDILKNHGLMKTTTLSHIGLVLFILFQAIIISKRFSRAFTRIKDAEREIRQLNDDLEVKVKDRTQTIRIILDNVKAGFLLVGPDLKIKEGFTRSCLDIIGSRLKEGQNLLDLFDLNTRERAHFQMAMGQIFADLLPAEVSLSQIHSRVSIGSRVIALQGSIVREENSSVHAILFTVTDATLLVNAERDARINQTLLSIMQDKQTFQSFVADSLQELKTAETAIKAGDENRVRLILHTLKGNFATYGLDEVAHYIHQTEDLESITLTQLTDISNRIQTFIKTYQDLIGLNLDVDSGKTVAVPYMAFDQFREVLQNLRASGEIQRTFEIWVHDVKLVPVRVLFGAMLTHASRLATRLGKDVEFHVTGGDILVSPEKLGAIISNLTHVLHNAIDHGIEFPEKRGNKNPRALIEVLIKRDKSNITITIRDDGQGLDMERIGEVAVDKGLITAEAFAKATDRERAQYIFLAGFSTASEVSEVSGRGVGMASLLDALHAMGGDIAVKSQQGVGCQFEMQVPDQLANAIPNKVA